MFNNLCECSPEEAQRQINYLSSTPVSGIAERLRNGLCVLKKGVVCSLQHLGNLKTEFGQIGPLTPGQGNGEKKFLVSEIVPVLRANPNVSDGGLLNKIEAIMESEAKMKSTSTLHCCSGMVKASSRTETNEPLHSLKTERT